MRDPNRRRQPFQPAPRQEPQEANPWVPAIVWGIVVLVVLSLVAWLFHGKLFLPGRWSVPLEIVIAAVAILTGIVAKLWSLVHRLSEAVYAMDDELLTHKHPSTPIPEEILERIKTLEGHVHEDSNDPPTEPATHFRPITRRPGRGEDQ